MNYLRSMFKFSLITFLSIVSLYVSAQKQNKTVTYYYDASDQPPEMYIDITHAKIYFKEIKPAEQLMIGQTWYDFKVLSEKLDSIVFNKRDIKILSCTLNDKEVKYKVIDGKLIIYPKPRLTFKSEHQISIEHEATPYTYPNFTGWHDTTNTKTKSIWGFSMSSAVPWVGIKHDLTTVETLITFDSKYKVLSNGTRLGIKKNKDGTSTWHYKLKNPHNWVLSNIVIGDYDYKLFKTKRGLDLEYWYYTGTEKYFDNTYKYSTEMFDFLEEEFGLNYPWEDNVYRQVPVADCPFGGMETTTGTVFNDNFICDDRAFLDYNYINVNVHELIHQWFGNYISFTNGENIWVSESFATYFSKKFEQYQLGEDTYQEERLKEYKRTMDAAVKDDFPVASQMGHIPRWYPKGSLVLDMLRYVMGEESFKTFISYYLDKHKYAVVEGNDYLIAIRESTGQTLDWFFKQWVYRGGEPHYEVKYNEYIHDDNEKATHIKVDQIHERDNVLIGLFKMPIRFEVWYKDGTSSEKTQWIEKATEEVIIPNTEKKEIDYVLFDPNRNILKKVSFNRSLEELSAQALKANNMIDRYDAILAMNDIPVSDKRKVLIDVFDKETYFLVKKLIIEQLKDDQNKETIALFKKAIESDDHEVRKAVAYYVTDIPEDLRADYEKLLKDKSYRVIEYSLKNLCENYTDKIDTYLDITKDEHGWWGKNIRMIWLEYAYESTGDEKYIKELLDYSNIDKYSALTVTNSMNSIKRLGYFDDELGRNIIKASEYWSGRIKPVAKEMKKYYSEQNRAKRFFELENSNE